MCIFARQLVVILHKHDKELGKLYNVSVGDGRIHPKQIERLKQAAKGDCTISVTLNPDELEAVRQSFDLDDEDIHQLHAALIAESVHRLLLDRVDPDKALELSEGLLQVLFKPASGALAAWRAQAFDDIRLLPEEIPPVLDEREQLIEHDLEPAVNAYEEALLWLAAAEVARDYIHRKGYAMLAVSLLESAMELVTYPSGIVEGTKQLEDWKSLFTTAQATAKLLADLS